jgi:hypothetical protein
LAKRSAKQKLIGWGVFAAVIVVIAAAFLVTRIIGGAAPETIEATTSVAVASSSSGAMEASATRAASGASSASAVAEPAPSEDAVPAASSAASAIPPDQAVVDAATMDQRSRRGLLLTLIRQGVFTGVQALDSPPKVGVTALFRGLSPSLQQQFVAVAYAYINNGASGVQMLELIDAASGAQIGTYTASDGLKLSES